MKIAIIVQEPVSVVLTPFVFWFSLPQCAPAIIDFFHDFTVHLAKGMFAVSPSLISFGMVMLRCVHPHEIAKKELMLLRISSVLQCEPRIRGCYSKKGRWRRVSPQL